MPGTIELSVCSVLLATIKEQSMCLPVGLKPDERKDVDTEALLDCGAGGIFMNRNFAERHQLEQTPLKNLINARKVDGTLNKLGTISHSTQMDLLINGKQFKTTFLITGLGKESIILGLPWLHEVNPVIDWKEGMLRFQEEVRLARVKAIVAKTRKNWGIFREKVNQVPRTKLP
jgi:hypothetical protein